MKMKPPELCFNINLAVFIIMLRAKLSFMRRDIAEFIKFGVSALLMTEMETRIDEFADTPTDEELVGNQGISTEAKDAQAEVVRSHISGIMTRVEAKFGNNTAKYRKFGINGISKLENGMLLLSAKRVYRVAQEYLEELASEGLTDEIMLSFKTDMKIFEDKLTAQENAISARDIATETRILMANELYHLMVRYCDKGKQIWGDTNEAKYNDYIIYDTPSGGPETPPTPPV